MVHPMESPSGGKKVSHRVVTTCLTCCIPSSILAPPHQLPPCTSPAGPVNNHSTLSPDTQTRAEGVESPSSAQPPPSEPPTPLDGPIRTRRRSKRVKPVPFWTRSDHPLIPLDQLGRSGSTGATGVKEGKGNGGNRPQKVKGGQKQGKAAKGKAEVEVSQPSGPDKNQQGRLAQASEGGDQPVAAKSSKLASTSKAISAEMDEEEMMNMC